MEIPALKTPKELGLCDHYSLNEVGLAKKAL